MVEKRFINAVNAYVHDNVNVIENYCGQSTYKCVKNEQEMKKLITSGKVKFALARIEGYDKQGRAIKAHSFLVYEKNGEIRAVDIGLRDNNGELYDTAKKNWMDKWRVDSVRFQYFIYIK